MVIFHSYVKLPEGTQPSTHSNTNHIILNQPQPISKEREVAGSSNGQWTDDGVRPQAFIAIRVPMNRHGAIT